MPALPPPPPARTWIVALLVAAVFYFGAALLAVLPVLPAPSRLLLGLESGPRNLDRTDQQMVMATITGNARRLLERPAVLQEEGQCFPLPKAYALGEHMFGEGLLAAPAWWATRDPVFSFNSMLVLRLWIPAMAMFAFVFHILRNPWAALLSGLLYGIHHYRVTDPVHSFVHGEMWLPLGLLCVHRLFEGGRWWPVIGLSLAVSLSILESLYPLLAVVIVLSVYSAFLAAKFPGRVPHVAGHIAAALVLPVLVAWWVFAPYLALKDSWGVLQGIQPLFANLIDYLPRGHYFPGAVLLVLATLGLADRVRGPRRTAAGDPRMAILAAGFACFWSSIYTLPVPFTDVRLPSPLSLGIGIVPGLDSARSLILVKIGFISSLAVLAGYGVLVLIGKRTTRTRAALFGLLTTAALLETLHPAVQPLFYGHRPQFEAYEGGIVGPYRSFIEREVVPPVLDIPIRVGHLATQAHYLQWASYHGGSTAACYNSFPSPVQQATAEIAARLPAPEAARALGAIGFTSVVLHPEWFDDDRATATLARFAAGSTEDFSQSARAGQHVVFRIPPPTQVDRSFDALSTSARVDSGGTIDGAGPTAEIPFFFTARAGATYRHPDPIEPATLVVTWRREGTDATWREEFRGLLPLAIAGGDQTRRRLDVPLPPTMLAGTYTATIARSAEPRRTLATTRVVVPGAGG